MEQRMYLEQRQVQRMVMTPRMQQAIKMLQIPTIELEALVEQEMIENPLLEEIPEDELQASETIEGSASLSVEDGDYEGRSASPQASEDWDTSNPDSADKPGTQDLSEGKIELSDDWERYFEDGSDTAATAPGGFDSPQDDEFERIIPDSISLREELERQLDVEVKSESDREVGLAIINSLDDDGYLGLPVEDISDQTGRSTEEVERVLRIFHTFDPPGIAARNLSECLEIQYHALNMDNPPMLEVIRRHLEDLERKRYQNITRALRISVAEVQEIADGISKFEPRPGRRLGAYENEYITPDVFVERVGDDWQVRVNDEGIAPLRISPRYRAMLENRDRTQTHSNNDPAWLDHIAVSL